MKRVPALALLALLGCEPGSEPTLTFESLQAAAGYGCALSSRGQAWCWGTTQYGALGDTTRLIAPTAAPVAGDLRFRRITTGLHHACGLTEAGAAWCWGANINGELGDGSRTDSRVPVAVLGGLSIAKISAGESHTCGITGGDSALWCWGADFGTPGPPRDWTRPSRITNNRWRDISVGMEIICGLTAAGEAWCWGANQWGSLGDGTTIHRNTPLPVATPIRFTSITTGIHHACALTAEGQAWCWGDNRLGQLGVAVGDSSLYPVAVNTDVRFDRLSSRSAGHNCGLARDGGLWCWGANLFGELGDGTTTPHLLPAPVDAPAPWLQIGIGFGYSCAIDGSGGLWCWGGNHHYQLGNGATDDASRPVRVVVGATGGVTGP